MKVSVSTGGLDAEKLRSLLGEDAPSEKGGMANAVVDFDFELNSEHCVVTYQKIRILDSAKACSFLMNQGSRS